MYKLKNSRTVNAARFTIVVDDIEVNDKSSVYSYVKIKPGVCVIVEVPEGFVLLREYRYPIKEWSLEFAAGCIDEGETPEAAAIREVQEETGYIVDSIVDLGKFYPSFGATDEEIYLFYAKCSNRLSQSLDATELIEFETVSEMKIDELIKTGEFNHGAGLAAWLRYKLNK